MATTLKLIESKVYKDTNIAVIRFLSGEGTLPWGTAPPSNQIHQFA